MRRSFAAGQTQTPSPPQPEPPLPPLPLTQLDERPRNADLDSRTISIRFAEPLSVRDLLVFLFRDTTFGIVVDPDVTGTFVGELRNVTLSQALDAILRPLGLDYAIENHTIHVFRRRVETRIFDVSYVLTRRSARRTLAAFTSIDGDSRSSSSQVTSTEEADVFEELSAGVQTLLSTEGRFNLDRKAALVQVTDFPDRLDRMATYVETVQNRVQRQVQIQAKVVEVELNEEFQAGIDWALVWRDAHAGAFMTQVAPPVTPGAFVFGIRIRDFVALIKAFERQGRVNVLSSPRVVAMNNEPAVMKVGTEDVYFLTTSQIDTTSGRVLQTTVTPRSVTEGVVLSVTPQISADGTISMSISPSVTERAGQAKSRFGDVVPVLRVRQADTLVRARHGDTVVIAGLMQDREGQTVTKVPGLGDVPLLGGLFRREVKTRRKTDLVILLTPTLVTSGQAPVPTSEEAAREQPR
ncbi:MAG: hypothetical protein HYX76_13100 [Acidobacteria bacterium]|nr:hypothetical protein [Acidobacteriota bacterium]